MKYYKYSACGELVEALQFNRTNFESLWSFTNGNVSEFSVKSEELGDAYCILHKTDYGDIQIQEGDYVAKNSKDRFYAMKPEVFETTYTLAATTIQPCDEIPVKR